jgi:hypothetical protein
MADRDDLTEFGQWEYDRAIIATSDDLIKYIAWQFDRLVDEVQGMSRHLCEELEGLHFGVWLVALPIWIIVGLYVWRLYFA